MGLVEKRIKRAWGASFKEGMINCGKSGTDVWKGKDWIIIIRFGKWETWTNGGTGVRTDEDRVVGQLGHPMDEHWSLLEKEKIGL